MAESLQSLKTRLKGVQNIGQITKAMELVSATKMRRSQEVALSSRPYSLTALDMLATLTKIEGVKLPAILTARTITKTAVVVITSDKGLAGAFNSAVIRAFEKFLTTQNIDLADPTYTFIAVGQKALSYLERKISQTNADSTQTNADGILRESASSPRLSAFTKIGDYTTKDQVAPLSKMLIEGYLEGRWDEVVVFSTHFKTALRQEVLVRRIFPVEAADLAATAKEIVPEHGRFAEMLKDKRVAFFNHSAEELREYLIEPSAGAVLDSLARHLVEAELYQLVLEANASEHAARRMAMKNASDNAADLSENLTLVYNKSRQASITREIIEITAGAESLR